MRTNAHDTPTMWGFIFLCLLAPLGIVGCASGNNATGTIAANQQAANDPDGRAKALLEEFNSLPEGDRADWVSMNTFALAVFENVSDSQLRRAYETQIKPLQQGR